MAENYRSIPGNGTPGSPLYLSADPRVAGLAAPPGSIGYNGTTYYRKYGPLASQWIQMGDLANVTLGTAAATWTVNGFTGYGPIIHVEMLYMGGSYEWGNDRPNGDTTNTSFTGFQMDYGGALGQASANDAGIGMSYSVGGAERIVSSAKINMGVTPRLCDLKWSCTALYATGQSITKVGHNIAYWDSTSAITSWVRANASGDIAIGSKIRIWESES